MELPPGAPLAYAVNPHLPLALAVYLQPRGVNNHVNRAVLCIYRKLNRGRFASPRKRGIVRHGQLDRFQYGSGNSLAAAQGKVKKRAYGQAECYRSVAVNWLCAPAPGGLFQPSHSRLLWRSRRVPAFDPVRGQPRFQAVALFQRPVVIRPVADFVTNFPHNQTLPFFLFVGFSGKVLDIHI